MLHYVRGDGGMPVVPGEELKDWLITRITRLEGENDTSQGVCAACISLIMELRAELEAIGRKP